MYYKACKLLGLEKNPSIVFYVILAYRDENSVASVKMFKVALNLCRAAKYEKLGLWLLRKMKEFNCRPDIVSYNVVIRLVVEKGELDEAMELMREMGLIDLYLDMITYISMINGFCDVGRLEDACQLIKCMKGHGCLPNALVYSTLLDGVCKHGSLEKALEFLGKMEKEDEDCRPNVVTYSTLIKGFVERVVI
ncbi:Pentatricopeptide repeat-containing protein [Abeliophyllum distichum]|uniref:Pentatricopeptide repeat-containing protein n=1 Tax=Abeliophyllum distichum TaxID=126358 RepID=A0ABD1V307_9LAMI